MNGKKNTKDKADYPEPELTTRLKLAYQWLNGSCKRLLDGGCSYGYGTRFFAEKAEETYGIDVDERSIEIARKRYRHINFTCAALERTPFDDGFFDAIVITDVLEHTRDKEQSLTEMHRILKKGGTIIITTPHKGLFEFLDPYNYGYYFRKYFPVLYKGIYKIVRLIKEGKLPTEYNQAHLEKHYHYSERNLIEILDKSGFSGNYEVEKVFKSGLFLEVFAMNLESVLNILISNRITSKVIKPFFILGTLDYWVKYSFLSYNIAMKIKKR